MNKDEIFAYVEYENVKPNMYKVSNKGRVVNCISGKELSQVHCTNGYREVALQLIDGSRKCIGVHRLVATAFIPKTQDDIINNRNVVHHKNFIKSCNIPENLEWTTIEENSSYNNNEYKSNNMMILPFWVGKKEAYWGGGENTKGEKNGMSRLTDSQVHIICACLEKGMSYYDCVISCGLEGSENDRFLISHIAQGHRWRNVSLQYDIPQTRKLNDFSMYINDICALLEKGLSSSQIVEELQMPSREHAMRVINAIRNKKTYINISSNYNF